MISSGNRIGVITHVLQTRVTHTEGIPIVSATDATFPQKGTKMN